MILTKEKIVELISKSLSYPEQITNWDFSDKSAVTFWWRGNHLCVTQSLDVNEIDGAVYRGSDLAITIRALLKFRWLAIEMENKE